MHVLRNIVLGALFAAAFATSSVAQYVVQFGELRGADYATLIPTTTIKLCEKSTGYRFGVQVSGPAAYDYYMIIKLPAPAGGFSFQNAGVSTQQQSVKTETVHAAGTNTYQLWFDKGDPAGAYNITVFAQNAKVASIDYNVVAAQSCM